MSWLDTAAENETGANTLTAGAVSLGLMTDNDSDMVNVLKLQLEEAQDHNQTIEGEMIKLKSQWELLAREREEKLQSELHQRLIEATERLELEEKVESSFKEIKKYQDTLQQSQEQLQNAQQMIEESQSRHLAVYEKYCYLKRMIRKYECVYKLVVDQLNDRDSRYKSFIQSLLRENVCKTLPSLHRILKKQPVKIF